MVEEEEVGEAGVIGCLFQLSGLYRCMSFCHKMCC